MSSILPDLGVFSLDDLRLAVSIYLGIAYPEIEPPPVVRNRIEWPEGAEVAALISSPPFERSNRASEGSQHVYALRLGNYRYPHMKLQVQPWPSKDGYLLSVNTHDQALSLSADSPDAEAFRNLQAENQRLKEMIEQKWDESDLPTFLRYLREYLNSQPQLESSSGA